MNLKAHNKSVFGSFFFTSGRIRIFSAVYGFLRNFADLQCIFAHENSFCTLWSYPVSPLELKKPITTMVKKLDCLVKSSLGCSWTCLNQTGFWTAHCKKSWRSSSTPASGDAGPIHTGVEKSLYDSRQTYSLQISNFFDISGKFQKQHHHSEVWTGARLVYFPPLYHCTTLTF